MQVVVTLDVRVNDDSHQATILVSHQVQLYLKHDTSSKCERGAVQSGSMVMLKTTKNG